MKLLKSKEAKLNSSVLNTIVLVIVLLVVLFNIYATLIPEAQSAGNLMNDSNRCEAEGCYYNFSTPVCLTNATTGNTVGCTEPSSIPLSGLFSGTGVVFVIIMAALLILVVKNIMKSK